MYLRSGPCCEELIEPIIHWVYLGDGINRCHFEEYMRAFHATPLEIQYIRSFNGGVEPQILVELRSKYGPDRNFTCTSISAAFRKLPRPSIGSSLFACSIRLRRWLDELPSVLVKALRRLKRRIRGILPR